jgi:hypothetical protein
MINIILVRAVVMYYGKTLRRSITGSTLNKQSEIHRSSAFSSLDTRPLTLNLRTEINLVAIIILARSQYLLNMLKVF